MADQIHGESTPADLHIFLTQLQTRAPIVVIPNEVCFRNAANRRAHYGNTTDVQSYELASNVPYIGRQSGTLMMVASPQNHVWEQTRSGRSGSWTEAEWSAHRQGEAEWHCFAMYFHMSTCYIYDSSYLPGAGRRRLGHLPNLHMARNVIRAWKTRLRLRQIWVGGGGNDENWCRNMTAQWMEDLVSRLQVGQGVDTDGWEQISL
ncbi:MAG: hypothetical protein M1823_004206 [Watsoniomyces obsoletus]|nr:MAG: hypothetical protein M1823_004206 [Watsoniomyces obsoletus]